MSMPVDNSASEHWGESWSAAAVRSRAVPMVYCNAMACTDEREGLKVLMTRSHDSVASTTPLSPVLQAPAVPEILNF